MSAPLRIVVDVTTWAPERTGIGLYTERLLRAWLVDHPEDTLYAASNIGFSELGPAPMPHIGPRFPVRAVWLQTALPLQTARLRPDFAFFPNYMAPIFPTCPYVVTVHDLAVFLYPETFTFKKRVLQRALLPTLVRRAAAVLTPSEATRRDVIRLLPCDPERIVAIPLAADDSYNSMPTAGEVALHRQTLKLPDHYVLAVGTLEPRKNLSRLISVFERVASAHPEVHLVIAGGRGWRDEDIHSALQQSPLQARIHKLGYVSAEALRVLYHEAIALCYPSLYEGFGLPVAEAMAMGTPVLTSRGSSLDEVAAGAALAVDPLSLDEMAGGLSRLLTDDSLRFELRQKGLARASQLSWRLAAQQTRAVFERLRAGEKPRQP